MDGESSLYGALLTGCAAIIVVILAFFKVMEDDEFWQ